MTTPPTYGYEQRDALPEPPAPTSPSRITAPPATEGRRVQAQLRRNVLQLIQALYPDTFRRENLYTAADRETELVAPTYAIPMAAADLAVGDVLSAELDIRPDAGSLNTWQLSLAAYAGAVKVAEVLGTISAGHGAYETLSAAALELPVGADTVKLTAIAAATIDGGSWRAKRPMIVQLDTPQTYLGKLFRIGTDTDVGPLMALTVPGVSAPGDGSVSLGALDRLSTVAGPLRRSPQPLVGGDTVDYLHADWYEHELTANLVLQDTNFAADARGIEGTLVLRQDAAGGHTVTWPAHWKGAGGAAVPQPDPAAGKRTVYKYFYFQLGIVGADVLVSVWGSGY